MLPLSKSSRNSSFKSQELQHREEVPSKGWEDLEKSVAFFPVKGKQKGLGLMPDHTSLMTGAQRHLLSASLSLRDSYEDKIRCHLKSIPPRAGRSTNLGHLSLHPAASLSRVQQWVQKICYHPPGSQSCFLLDALCPLSRPSSSAGIPRDHPHPSPGCHPSPSKLARVP